MQIRHSKEMIKGVSSGVSIIIKLVLCCPLVTFCMSRILYVGTTQVVVMIYKQFGKKTKVSEICISCVTLKFNFKKNIKLIINIVMLFFSFHCKFV